MFDGAEAPRKMEKEHGRYQKMPGWWESTIPLDVAVFADDDIWFHAAIDEPLVDACDFIDENAEFERAIVDEYAASRVDDLARPKELRTINFSDNALLEKQCADSLVRLWRQVPPLHATQLAHIPDKWVQRVLLTKALGEVETIKSLEEWVGLIRRCFSLAAILRKAALLRQRSEGLSAASAGGDTHVISEEEAAAEAASMEEDRRAKEQAFQDEMNWLADNNIEEYNKRLAQQKEDATRGQP